MASRHLILKMIKKGLFLPLPPSKNERKIPVTYYDRKKRRYVNMLLLSAETKLFKAECRKRFGKEKLKGVFADKVDTRIILDWFVPDMRRDIVNYHDDMCDAIQDGIGVNDRYFLLTDNSRTVNKKETGVMVTIMQKNVPV